MCKYTDTNLSIKRLAFGEKRGMMTVVLSDGREVMVPVGMFPDIKRLSLKQRMDYMILETSTSPSRPTAESTPSRTYFAIS